MLGSIKKNSDELRCKNCCIRSSNLIITYEERFSNDSIHTAFEDTLRIRGKALF